VVQFLADTGEENNAFHGGSLACFMLQKYDIPNVRLLKRK